MLCWFLLLNEVAHLCCELNSLHLILYISYMKLIITSTFFFIFTVHYLLAQKNKIAGNYSLTGVMEIASGIQLNEDSTFLFYFSYGALDRYGSGKWSVLNDNIILDSKSYPGKDFKMVSSSSVKNNFTTIKIEDKNTNLYRLVYCLVKTPRGDTIINANEKGIIVVQHVIDTIYLLCELCPERITSFGIKSQKHNRYTFNFEPWITEVFFKSFKLRYVVDHLEGKHPLLDDKQYIFQKEN